jgi:hypothetical protein
MDDHHEEEDSADMVHDMDFMDSEPTPKEQQGVSDRSIVRALTDGVPSGTTTESGVFVLYGARNLATKMRTGLLIRITKGYLLLLLSSLVQ